MDIKLKDLQGDQRELAEIIGIEAYLELVKIYAEIVKKFNGFNYKQLAFEYHLAERTVREIIARENTKQGATQLSFFNDS